LKNELYAKILENPGYLAENNYQIVTAFHPGAAVLAPTPDNIERLRRGELKLRQTPGRHNALGAAKFMFPNDHAVYLHGTPAKRLFKKDRRDFSHGCIRVADPPRLAEHVLRDKESWSRERVDSLIAGGKWRQVGLDRPLDVFVLYGTVVADPDGTVRFFSDIYGHDQRLAQALDQAATAPDFKGAVRWGGEYPTAVVQLTSGEPDRYPGE
jgi:murein L,D-transpeptidase YcbB/YkuD